MADSAPVVWLANASMLTVSLILFASLIIAASFGYALQRWVPHRSGPAEAAATKASNQESYLVSGVLGLLALLLAFTFGLALNRYELRRQLVVTEANAIGTSYLRAQLLDEPHRTRLSNLLVVYTENRIKLGATNGDIQPLLAANDRLLTQIWAAVVASAESASSRNMIVPITVTYNELIDLDTERKVARLTRVPAEVLLVLYVYLIVTAAVLGYVLEGVRGRIAAAILFLLLTLSVAVIVDLNRPVSGTIRESQEPLRMLQRSLAEQPPAVFDRYRSTAPHAQD